MDYIALPRLRNNPTIYARPIPINSMKENDSKGSDKGDVKSADAKNEIKDNKNRVSMFALFRFADARDKVYIVLGLIAGVGAGVGGPLRSVFQGKSIGGFTDEDPMEAVKDQVVNMLYLAAGVVVCAGLMEYFWTSVGERIGVKVRTLYLQSVLKKEVTWFDINRPQELPTKISSLITKYQTGIGEKVGKVVMTLSMFLAGLVIALVYGWQLALVFLGLTPLIVLAAHFISISNTRGAETAKRAYAKCGGYAEEAITAVRTVYAFCAEEFEQSKYMNELGNTQKTALNNSLFHGLAVGLISFTMSLCHGLGYFIGSFFIEHEVHNHLYDKAYDTSLVMTVFFAALMAMFSLGMIAPQAKSIDEARMAAYDIYDVIDSVATVDKKEKERGNITIPPEQFKGLIEFKNVSFYYPTRPDVKVLDNFSMAFEPGKMVGVCGETGSGKSTIIQLIERFYSPSSGVITVDGIDLNTLDIKWWRSMVGYVGQEPVLFNTSIRANIEYGKEGATMEEIEQAAAQANAIEFIKKLKDGYETVTGSEGSQLSGGQKQRVAIARGLLKRPRILLLDEATSALDGSSERKVQHSFAKLQKENSMSIISIAHRLTTIQNADKIIVLHDGVLKEEGTDKELRELNTIYANLCRLQDCQAEEVEGKEMEAFGQQRNRSTSRRLSLHNGPPGLNDVTEAPQLSKEEQEKQMALIEEKSKNYRSQLWAESLKHKKAFIGAVVLSVLAGGQMPFTGMLFGMVSMDLQDPDDMRRKINLDFMGYCIIAVCMLAISIGMFGSFGYVASNVTRTLRERLYNGILRMDVGWFDLPSNIPSNLNTLLAEGTENINGVVRMISGTMIQCISAIVIALALGFAFSWKMALIVLGCVPLIGLTSFIQAKFHMGFSKITDELYKDSIKILTEAVKNFRTVASFSSQEKVLKLFTDSLEKPLANSQNSAIVAGVLFGLGQLIINLVFAGLFYFAVWFMVNKGDDPRDSFIAVYSLLFAAMSIGQMQQYAPDIGKAYTSLFSIYGILEQQPKVTSPKEPTNNQVTGRIEFKNVKFKYPTRDDYVLQDVSFNIEPGQKVAIVGISGSGKSTIIQLLERFYDIENGEILLDGINIKEYDIKSLRKLIGYVPQEPILFDTTIEENVKYGYFDATREEVEKACKIANAVDFILKDEYMPRDGVVFATSGGLMDKDEIDIGKGYERKVGAKGSLLSGGQKQRLAIARAILRDPKIMLFDEATSALDSETEKVVQKALNQVSVGRTSVVVAHRLGTIEAVSYTHLTLPTTPYV
eukprot:TRINITY_DN5133_c0_g1_i7.p1 TRINITY_DN5133_c0_g1~~TRINITY_DN5133_c0_g1_i7.p1  ORF type:complete len:1278 (-),score=456.32 TRINITY_DN5133_c0_g1_i7:19-3852(-)